MARTRHPRGLLPVIWCSIAIALAFALAALPAFAWRADSRTTSDGTKQLVTKYASEEDEKGDLYLVNKATGEEIRIASTASGDAVASTTDTAAISPDGTFVVFATAAADIAGNEFTAPSRVPYSTGADAYGYLYVYNVASRSITRVTPGAGVTDGACGHWGLCSKLSEQLYVGADGTVLIMSSQHGIAGETSHSAALYRATLPLTSAPLKLFTTGVNVIDLLYGDSRYVVFGQNLAANNAIPQPGDTPTEEAAHKKARVTTVALGDGIWRFDSTTGDFIVWLTEDEVGGLVEFKVSEDGTTLAVVTSDSLVQDDTNAGEDIYIVDVGGSVTKITDNSSNAFYRDIVPSDSGTVVAYREVPQTSDGYGLLEQEVVKITNSDTGETEVLPQLPVQVNDDGTAVDAQGTSILTLRECVLSPCIYGLDIGKLIRKAKEKAENNTKQFTFSAAVRAPEDSIYVVWLYRGKELLAVREIQRSVKWKGLTPGHYKMVLELFGPGGKSKKSTTRFVVRRP